MSTQTTLLIIYMIGLVAINIAAFRYIGLFGFFVTAASIPYADKILGMIEKL
tara:strand:+ start:19460 stop:19615 length:156 start_codon:yes stop_codon:yes gene_type:complete